MTHTFIASGPDVHLTEAYADEIKKIHDAIESAIHSSRFSTEDDGDRYVETGVYIPHEFRDFFSRMYLGAGWSHLHTGYDTARLYPKQNSD